MSHCWSREKSASPPLLAPTPLIHKLQTGVSKCCFCTTYSQVLGFLKKRPCYKLCLSTEISLPIVCIKAHSRATGISKSLCFEVGESRQLRRARIQSLYFSDPRESTALVIDVLPRLYKMWDTIESIAQSNLSVCYMQTAIIKLLLFSM